MTRLGTPADGLVSDDEVLFRAIHGDAGHTVDDGPGGRRISAMAFNDRFRRPSVDRAALCPGGAADTRDRFRPGSGVLSLVARQVRDLRVTHGATGCVYAVDVEPAPLPDNPAHAEILGRPPFDTDRVFERVKQALALIAVVVITPDHPASLP